MNTYTTLYGDTFLVVAKKLLPLRTLAAWKTAANKISMANPQVPDDPSYDAIINVPIAVGTVLTIPEVLGATIKPSEFTAEEEKIVGKVSSPWWPWAIGAVIIGALFFWKKK